MLTQWTNKLTFPFSPSTCTYWTKTLFLSHSHSSVLSHSFHCTHALRVSLCCSVMGWGFYITQPRYNITTVMNANKSDGERGRAEGAYQTWFANSDISVLCFPPTILLHKPLRTPNTHSPFLHFSKHTNRDDFYSPHRVHHNGRSLSLGSMGLALTRSFLTEKVDYCCWRKESASIFWTRDTIQGYSSSDQKTITKVLRSIINWLQKQSSAHKMIKRKRKIRKGQKFYFAKIDRTLSPWDLRFSETHKIGISKIIITIMA